MSSLSLPEDFVLLLHEDNGGYHKMADHTSITSRSSSSHSPRPATRSLSTSDSFVAMSGKYASYATSSADFCSWRISSRSLNGLRIRPPRHGAEVLPLADRLHPGAFGPVESQRVDQPARVHHRPAATTLQTMVTTANWLNVATMA